MKKGYACWLGFTVLLLWSSFIALPLNAQPVASVSIIQSTGANPSCYGSALTFTASPVNGGSSPVFHWYLNGTLSLTAGAVFSPVSLPAGNSSIYCTMSSNLPGVLGSPATSDTINILVFSRPVSTLSGTINLCTGDTALLSLHFSGIAPFSGRLSDSTAFFSLFDTLLIPVSPASNTSYQISYFNDSSLCPSSVSGSAVLSVRARPTASISGDTTLCADNNAPLTISTAGSGIIHGTITNGGSFSGAAGVIHLNVSPPVDSTYYITALNDANCPALPANLSDSAVINVIPLPLATISDNDTLCAGQSSVLQMSFSHGAPWQVVYSDGSRPDTFTAYSSPVGIIVSPSISTTYRITSVHGIFCAARPSGISGTAILTVNPKPVAVIDPLPLYTQCLVQNSFAFHGNHSSVRTGTIMSWNWSFGGLNPDSSFLAAPTLHFTDTGSNRTVTLIVASNYGCLDTTTAEVSLLNSPNPSFTLSDTAICNGMIIDVHAAADTSSQFTWMWGDGLDSICKCSDNAHRYTATGDKRLQLMMQNTSGCKDTAFVTVQIHANPTVSFTLNDTAQCYAGNTFILTDHSNLASIAGYHDSLTIYNWSLGDHDTAGGNNIVHTYANNLTSEYGITEFVGTNFGCIDSNTHHVFLYHTPSARIQNNQPSDSLCTGTAYLLTASTNAIVPGFRWTQSDTNLIGTRNFISGTSTAIITPHFNSYILQVTDSANNKCTALDTMVIKSLPNPETPLLDSSELSHVCDSSNLPFSVLNIASGVNYFWYTVPALPISGQGVAHCNVSFGSDSVLVAVLATNIPYGCSKSAEMMVHSTAGMAPKVSIIAMPDLIDTTLVAVALPDLGITYQWGYDSNNFTPHFISGATTQDLLLDSGQISSTYWVIITDTSTQCASKTYFSTPETSTSILSADGGTTHLSISPNPVISKFELEIHSPVKHNWNISIFTEEGKLMLAQTLHAATSEMLTVDASAWPSGMYFLSTESEWGEKMNLKMIKE